MALDASGYAIPAAPVFGYGAPPTGQPVALPVVPAFPTQSAPPVFSAQPEFPVQSTGIVAGLSGVEPPPTPSAPAPIILLATKPVVPPTFIENPWAPKTAENLPGAGLVAEVVTPPAPPADPIVEPALPIFLPAPPVELIEVPTPPTPPVESVARPVVLTSPEPDDYDDDELDSTIVVDRRPKVQWTLVLDDGTSFPLSGGAVALGRNPAGSEGVQALTVPDATRTLSKTHARLELDDGEWTVIDLNSTNGVMVVDPDGSERLLAPGASALVPERFILGKVGMSLRFEEQR